MKKLLVLDYILFYVLKESKLNRIDFQVFLTQSTTPISFGKLLNSFSDYFVTFNIK